jgi:hypothetical protein
VRIDIRTYRLALPLEEWPASEPKQSDKGTDGQEVEPPFFAIRDGGVEDSMFYHFSGLAGAFAGLWVVTLNLKDRG